MHGWLSATGLSVVPVQPIQFTAWGFERPQLRVRHRQTHSSTAGRSVKHARAVTCPPGPRKPHANENAPQGRKPARYEVWSYFCTCDEFYCICDELCSKTLTLQQNMSFRCDEVCCKWSYHLLFGTLLLPLGPQGPAK